MMLGVGGGGVLIFFKVMLLGDLGGCFKSFRYFLKCNAMEGLRGLGWEEGWRVRFFFNIMLLGISRLGGGVLNFVNVMFLGG